jgi:hypothetical protein
MIREDVYGGLWAKLSTIPGFVTKSRRLKHWNDVPLDKQPALFMAQTGEIPNTTTAQPGKWQMRVDLYVYASTKKDKEPGPIINPLLDAICNLVNKQNPITGRTDLNIPGVHTCRIEGNIEVDEGTLGDQAVAIIPVVILAT